MTKGISDIGLRKEQALEKEIENDASNMGKRNKNAYVRKLKNSRSKKSSQRALIENARDKKKRSEILTFPNFSHSCERLSEPHTHPWMLFELWSLECSPPPH